MSISHGTEKYIFKGEIEMKKGWKKFLAASVACAAMVGFSTSAMAAYQLSDEVKDVTPALKIATQIGVKVNENPELKDLPNKDAIVVMSFGTTFVDSRNKTINPTVAAIQAAHPDVPVIITYTSHIIRDRVLAKEGIKIPTPEEALDDLKAQGYTRIALATLDVIPGIEYDYKNAVFNLYKDNFKKMTFGTPLMYWQGQEEQPDDIEAAMQALSTQFPKTGKSDAILIMAHGTPHPANAYYSVMQQRLNEINPNAIIFSVEGWPSIETVIPQLKAKKIKNITLMPMMMVAGDHANNDMAGDEDDSYKSILQAEGFKVDCYLHGMGENEGLRGLFVERANDAYAALVK